ncbi:MAG TPA: 16S rRNA (guanine(966)-N(2))-methyltransferase RsmD [Bryobacteraceae bacterium]|nr:16S rRNA (guanine(966)-N(2))-methyltransferase RsmD [Bryobacteraceae bacterium]
MRVIGGEHRSRRLKSLPGEKTRPTPDRLRETLFDILALRIEGVVFLDAYAGTGAVGIEALSRGAREAIFIEKSHLAADVIRENLKALGLETRARVVCGKTISVLARSAADIVFLDPPYELENEYGEALALMGANPPELVIAQHDVRQKLNDQYGRLRRTREVRQGDNVLSFYAEEVEE